MNPVLLLTHDNTLYQHWSGLSEYGWAPARGKAVADLQPWGQRGVSVIMDARYLQQQHDLINAKIPAGLQIIVASMNPNDPEGQRALTAGASGYVHAYMPNQGLDKVLRHVMGGEIWVGHSLLARMLSQISQAVPEQQQQWAADLTVRERDVARYVAQGHSNQSIAGSLGITERTVRAHINAIFNKLNISDRLQLALIVHGVK